jgi:phage protein D
MASSLRLPERAALGISIAGESVTSEFKPFLITVSATDKDNAGGEIDECLIELDDSYGQLRLPGTGDPISINMGWRGGVVRNVFTGVVSDVESGFSKNEGRRLFIQGKGADPLGLGKQQFKQDWGTGETDVPLSKVMEEAAGVAGYEIVIAKELAALTRKYWSQNRESFWNLGHRLARELGGTFRLENRQQRGPGLQAVSRES